MAQQPLTNERQFPSHTWTDRFRHLADAMFGMLLVTLLASPVAAAPSGTELVEQLGTDIGSAGGGAFAFVVWFLLMLVLLVKGFGRMYSAIDHMGSLYDDERSRGRQEIKFGGLTFLAGLLGVPVAATFVGRILPDSWSWIGVDLSQYVSVPGAGTIYIPVGETMDTALVLLPALV